MNTRQTMQVTCPACRSRFVAQLQDIVDVGREPALKRRLLNGQLNVATCPYCRNTGMLAIPLLYHDPARELALCFVPMEMGLKRETQERLIGRLTNRLIDSLPPERRKSYLLQPRIVFTLPKLLEEIWQADGVSREMLDAHARKVRLIGLLLERMGDEERFHALVEEREEELGYDFFLTLSAFIDAARRSGQEKEAQQLISLREALLVQVQPPAPPVREGVTVEEFVEALLQVSGEAELEALVAVNRPALDYTFFRTLTASIEQAEATGDTDRAGKLRDLRARILAVVEKQDREIQAALERAALLLRDIIRSREPEKTLRDRLSEIDEAFLVVLSANIEKAEAEGQKEVSELLRGLMGLVMALLEESQPPEIRLINQLLEAEYPQETERILRERVESVDEPLLEVMQAIVGRLQARGAHEVARKLLDIREQAALISGTD